MTKEELQKIIAIDEGFRIELTKSKGEVETIKKVPTPCKRACKRKGSFCRFLKIQTLFGQLNLNLNYFKNEI